MGIAAQFGASRDRVESRVGGVMKKHQRAITLQPTTGRTLGWRWLERESCFGRDAPLTSGRALPRQRVVLGGVTSCLAASSAACVRSSTPSFSKIALT